MSLPERFSLTFSLTSAKSVVSYYGETTRPIHKMKNITCPPAAKIARELNLDEDTAKAIRERIKKGYKNPSHDAAKFMEDLNKLGEFAGVESCYPKRPELYYLNAGDTYNTTLIFNYATGSVRIGCWGDIKGI